MPWPFSLDVDLAGRGLAVDADVGLDLLLGVEKLGLDHVQMRVDGHDETVIFCQRPANVTL